MTVKKLLNITANSLPSGRWFDNFFSVWSIWILYKQGNTFQDGYKHDNGGWYKHCNGGWYKHGNGGWVSPLMVGSVVHIHCRFHFQYNFHW